MKTKFYSIALACLAAIGLFSCTNFESSYSYDVYIDEGVYLLNAGNYSKGTPGSITYYDYDTKEVTQKVYQTVNGESLGGTVNDAVVYGSKIYIVGSDEKTVFVADKNTMKKIKALPITDNGTKLMPRHAVAGGGKVYVTTWSETGKNDLVVAIDTTTCSLSGTYDCGLYPEGLTYTSGYLLVANSDYGNCVGNASISWINLSTGVTTDIKPDGDVKLMNCDDVKCYGNYVLVLDQGSYDTNWNQSGEAVYNLVQSSAGSYSLTQLCSATKMALDARNGYLYTFDAPYTYPATSPNYNVYNLDEGTSKKFIDGSDIAYPSNISADPYSGNVYITSYNMNSGYADYNANGYCVSYNAEGTKLIKFDTGVGPGIVVPNVSVYHIEK